ncbi:hypothetical protein IQ07DRAFT_649487 [Pyrenochaeta sp. DS3sAY3a]|nr:hypothetical protein IQ07DRAFT_649487 [Pyrenochaeta sp. DS3sAY3a]
MPSINKTLKYTKFRPWQLRTEENDRLAYLLGEQGKLRREKKSQPFYTYVDCDWTPVNPKAPPKKDNQPGVMTTDSPPGFKSIYVITWSMNTDISKDGEMKQVLSCLETEVNKVPKDAAVVINLQVLRDWGIQYEPRNLKDIKSTPWVQERFNLTAVDKTAWEFSKRRKGFGFEVEGLLTMSDCRMAVVDVFQLPLVTLGEEERSALVLSVSIELKKDDPNSEKKQIAPAQEYMHFANVQINQDHLDLQRAQMMGLYHQLLANSSTYTSTVIAGVCGMRWKDPQKEPLMYGLRDASLELGHIPGDPEQNTRSANLTLPLEELRQDKQFAAGAVRPVDIDILRLPEEGRLMGKCGVMVGYQLKEGIEHVAQE